MRKLQIFVLLLVFGFSNAANAVILGYVTGSDYQDLSSQERQTWATGINQDNKSYLSECLEQYKLAQLIATFEKELAANPESWHAPAAIVFRSVTSKFCKEVNETP